MEVFYFEVADLLGVAMTLVVLGIGIAYGLNVVGDVRDDFCQYGSDVSGCLNSTGGTSDRVYSMEYNASNEGALAIAKIPQKLGLVVTVVLAAVIIGVLVRYLFVRFG